LVNAAGLALGAEEALAPATLAFASVDGLIDDGDISPERTAFSKSIGASIAALRCIPTELRGIATFQVT
jgi:hypothetical protein